MGRGRRRKLGRLRHQPQLDRALMPLGPHRVPALVEHAVIGGDEGRWRLHRDMHCLQGQEGEERLFRCALVNIADQLVDQIARGVEILGQGDRLAILEPVHRVVAGQIGLGVVIAPAGGIHHVGAIKAKGVGQVGSGLTDAPLAGDKGLIPRRAEQAGDGGLLTLPHHRIAGLAFHLR